MKKYFSRLSILAISCQLIAISHSNAQTGTWTKLTHNAPAENNGLLLLLTNGNVLATNINGGTYGTGWNMLTPDATGSYVNGTWSTIASMNSDRFSFSSQVLQNGNVWVAGGEYGAGGTTSEYYNTLTNTWTTSTGVPAGWNIYDAPSELLYNGKVLDGPEIGASPSFDCIFYNLATNACSIAPSAPLNHDEAQWLKLPDSSVLFVGIASRNSCRYIPQTNSWVSDATVPVSIYDVYGEESGCGLNLPNGKAIFFGATQHNAIYTPTGNHTPGTWAAAADFPEIRGTYVGQTDAPGAMMVNGHILLACSPVGTSANEFQTPTYFVEYDYTTNAFTQVTSPIPGIGGDSIVNVTCQQLTFLDLPDGTVMMSLDQDGGLSNDYWIYTPGSAAIPQGKPTIDGITALDCDYFSITGKLFNGISEGSSYGDDVQNATNYPLVRFTDGTNVYYARTTNWNRIGALQTDSLEDTAYFTVPLVPPGTYSVVVVANGFASNPVTVYFSPFEVAVTSLTNSSCRIGGSATVAASSGATPYTYSWSPGGGTNPSVSNLSAGTYTVTVTQNGGCSVTTPVTIIQLNQITISPSNIEDVKCHDDSSGSASVQASGGISPYTYSWAIGGTNSSISGLTAGTYTLTVTDSCGSSSSSSVTITQPTALVVTSSSVMTDTGSCTGTARATVYGGTAPYTYSWASGQRTASITSQCAGDYCCTVTDKNGCTQTVCASVMTTGIENIEQGRGQIDVYPNPNNGIFTMVVKSGKVIEKNIEVFNVLGEKVYSQFNIQHQTFNIDLSTQPEGIYLYRVLSDKGELVGQGKVVIEK